MRAPALLPLLPLLFLPILGRATPRFPEGVKTKLELAAAPDCSLCHRGTPAFETAVTPFALAMKERGLQAYNETSLRVALDALQADAVDSDGDGFNDVEELISGSDPNGTVAIPDPEYGCGGGGTVVALAPLWLLRRRRASRKRT